MKYIKLFESFKLTEYDLNEIYEGYIECAIWSSEDDLNDNGDLDGLDDLDMDLGLFNISIKPDLNIENIAPESKQKIMSDIKKFLEIVGDAVSGLDPSQIGHDIWLTRNGHGVGFWDRGLDNEISDILCDACEELGTSSIYLGDDMKLYVE
jgi:hypothetical protein